jgi:cytochrome oxidase assembly protein ShyY1
MKKNKFNPGARITIFFVTFAIIFFSLGLWQIERGQAKTVLLDEFDKNSVIEPQEIKQDSKKMGKGICGRNMVWSQSNIN